MKKYFYVFLASVIYYLVLAILKGQHYERLYGDIASAIAGFVGLYAFTYVLLKRNKEQKILWLLFVIWLGISIIELPMRIFYNKAMGTFFTYIYWCAGIIGGYLFWRTNKFWKIIVSVISLCIVCTIPRCIVTCYGNKPYMKNNTTEISCY